MSLLGPTLMHQMLMYSSQIAHQSRGDDDYTYARLAAHRHLTIAKGMFDGTDGGFHCGAQVVTTGVCLCTALSSQGQVHFVLREAQHTFRGALER